jgi:sarcosine oxidase
MAKDKNSNSKSDCIVIGTGGVGSAALYHLARRGVRVLGLDRFPAGHDRGSSHGESRIIRLSYSEHPDYVPLLFRAYELWEELGRESGKLLYTETGFLMAGRPESGVVSGVLESARIHDLEVEELSPAEVTRRFPGVQLASDMDAVLDARAGFLRVEDCVVAHIEAARKHGAELRTGETVLDWEVADDGSRVVVRTDQGEYESERLVITAGPWAGDLLAELGVPLQVVRKALFWYRTREPVYRADRGHPCYLVDTGFGRFYGVPEIHDGEIKVAEHSGGQAVDDPLTVKRDMLDEDRLRIEGFLAECMPAVEPECTRHVVCMYTRTPDEHFVVGCHPRHSSVAFAAGLSGHGFKFTGVLGEVLADLVTRGTTDLPIEFLGFDRFLGGDSSVAGPLADRSG